MKGMTKQQVIALILESSMHDPLVKAVLDNILSQIDIRDRRGNTLKCLETHYDTIVGHMIHTLLERNKSLTQTLIEEAHNRPPSPIIIRK